jgi:DHA1 family bicyclomycin/chloramphenicol resistance-like MFS transporter
MSTPSPSLADRRAFTHGKGLVLLLGALTAFDPLTIDMYLPAFGDIGRALHASPASLELSVSTFFVGMALGQLVYGPLADRFGRRRPLVAGMLLYLVATIGCATSTSISMFIGFRLLQALGGCAGMVVSRAVVRDLFEARQVAAFLSNMALVMGLAPILAPTLGAAISSAFGWRAIFVVLACANVLCILAVTTLLPETLARRQETLRPAAVLRVFGGLLRTRSFVGNLVPDTAIRAGMFAYIAGSPFVFIELLHIPASRYGLVFGLNGLGLMAASQLNRLLLRRYAPQTILRASVAVAALAATCVVLAAWTQPTRLVLLPAIFVFLATLNFVGPNAMAQAMASQGHQAGSASALYGSMQWSLAFFASLLVSRLHDGTARPMATVIFGCGLVSFSAYRLLAPRARPVS